MRLHHEALLRIRPISPISDNAPDTAIYNENIIIACIANNTSGTFDPDLQFNGQDIQSGAFGDLIDIWIKRTAHRDLRARIDQTATPFSAKLMLRLFALYERSLAPDGTPILKDINLIDNLETLGEGAERERGFIGFPLEALRVFPTFTSLTFNAKRVML